jgi:hypothetical protein
MSEALLKRWRSALPYTGGQAKIVLRRMIAELESEIECRAKAGDSETGGKLVSGVDPAGRLADGRTSAATEVAGRDSRERPAPKPNDDPLSHLSVNERRERADLPPIEGPSLAKLMAGR